jgi:hypothetical protein
MRSEDSLGVAHRRVSQVMRDQAGESDETGWKVCAEELWARRAFLAQPGFLT